MNHPVFMPHECTAGHRILDASIYQNHPTMFVGTDVVEMHQSDVKGGARGRGRLTYLGALGSDLPPFF